ncbi:hypothetical protein ACE418_01245 [Megasphaera sp. WILCCON 0056]|uniref:hypothetical protein n=1 Tax=Megasphaera sp. WILCCON 0056 TaxID=3345340 RepID=UPI003A7FA827
MFNRQKEKERALIAGDASAEAVAALFFMALHDEFRFGKVRVEKIFRLWNDLPYSAAYEAPVSRNGYNRGRMDRNFIKKIMVVIGADKIDNKRLRNTLYQVLTETVINMLYVLETNYGFRADEVHRLEKRLYDYADIMLDTEAYGVTIWQFMACIRYELNVRCDMLKEYEKQYGRVDLGPKWGINMITGKPRKKNEAIA